MRKHGGTPSWRDKHVTLAAISPPGVARGRFVGGQQSGPAGYKPPPLFTRGGSSCSSQGRRQGEPWGTSPRPSALTYLPQRCSPHNIAPSGFKLPFLPSFHLFFLETFVSSLPLDPEPLCPPRGGLVSKEMCSAKCERCRMTCKSFSTKTASPLRRCSPFKTLVPLAS